MNRAVYWKVVILPWKLTAFEPQSRGGLDQMIVLFNSPKYPDPSKLAILRTYTPQVYRLKPLHWRVQGFLGWVIFRLHAFFGGSFYKPIYIWSFLMTSFLGLPKVLRHKSNWRVYLVFASRKGGVGTSEKHILFSKSLIWKTEKPRVSLHLSIKKGGLVALFYIGRNLTQVMS